MARVIRVITIALSLLLSGAGGAGGGATPPADDQCVRDCRIGFDTCHKGCPQLPATDGYADPGLKEAYVNCAGACREQWEACVKTCQAGSGNVGR
jgi:hypothetical protein